MKWASKWAICCSHVHIPLFSPYILHVVTEPLGKLLWHAFGMYWLCYGADAGQKWKTWVHCQLPLYIPFLRNWSSDDNFSHEIANLSQPCNVGFNASLISSCFTVQILYGPSSLWGNGYILLHTLFDACESLRSAAFAIWKCGVFLWYRILSLYFCVQIFMEMRVGAWHTDLYYFCWLGRMKLKSRCEIFVESGLLHCF